jgi:ankyrin repeat protein
MDRIPYGLRNTPEVGHEFIKAVIKDNYDRIKELMSVGGNINSKNINESSALMAATIIKKDPLMVKFLLENGADPNIKLKGYGYMPLINFMATNDIDIDTYTKKKIIELLIKYGATPDYNFSKGRNASTISAAALNSREERYLREREYRNKQLGEKKLNFSKLMNYRLGETAEQPDEMENINRIGTMIDDAEDKKRDEELRGELVAEYTNILDMYGGGYRKY